MGEVVKYSTCTYVRCSRKQIRSVCESHAQSVGNLEIKVKPKEKKGGKDGATYAVTIYHSADCEPYATRLSTYNIARNPCSHFTVSSRAVEGNYP